MHVCSVFRSHFIYVGLFCRFLFAHVRLFLDIYHTWDRDRHHQGWASIQLESYMQILHTVPQVHWRGLEGNFSTQNRSFLYLQISVDLGGNLWRWSTFQNIWEKENARFVAPSKCYKPCPLHPWCLCECLCMHKFSRMCMGCQCAWSLYTFIRAQTYEYSYVCARMNCVPKSCVCNHTRKDVYIWKRKILRINIQMFLCWCGGFYIFIYTHIFILKNVCV